MIDRVELAVREGAARALRKRAAAQNTVATAGTVAAGEHFPNVRVRQGEAVIAARIAEDLERIALDIEGGAL